MSGTGSVVEGDGRVLLERGVGEQIDSVLQKYSWVVSKIEEDDSVYSGFVSMASELVELGYQLKLVDVLRGAVLNALE